MLPACKSFLQRRKEKQERFFLSVANGSIRTSVSVHTKRIHQQICFYENTICMKYCNLLKVETSETGQVEEQNLDRIY